jgi:hypothetical protein
MILNEFSMAAGITPTVPALGPRKPASGKAGGSVYQSVCVLGTVAIFSSSLAAAWKADTLAWTEQPVVLRPSPGQLPLRNSVNPQRRSNTYSRSSARPASDPFCPQGIHIAPSFMRRGARRARWSSSARFCAWSGVIATGLAVKFPGGQTWMK